MKLKTVTSYEDGHTVSIYEGTGCEDLFWIF